MNIINPGNVLPFYNRKTWQRHRQTGTDVLPFGIIAPNSRLLPFQVRFAGEVYESATWSIIDASDEDVIAVQSPTLLTVEVESGGSGFWVTWYAAVNLTIIPECGFYYIKLTVNDVEYFSEVLHLKPDNNFDSVSVVIDDCDFLEGIITLTVRAEDQLSAAPVSETIEYFDSGMWNTVGDNEGTINFLDFPPNQIQVRRIVETASGVTITANYLVTWSNPLSPCDDIDIAQDGAAIYSGGSSTERWRFRMNNSTDKGDVLFQNGFQLWYYFTPVYDAPTIERENDSTINGEGTEVSRFTRTVERWKFEAADVPDYVCHFFATAGDLDTILIENVATADAYFAENLRFVFRRQSPSLNIGEFSFDRRIEVFSGCQPNFALE